MRKYHLKKTNHVYSTKFLKGIFLLLLMGLMLPIYSQENVNFTKISELEDYASSYNDLAIQGQYAYCIANYKLDIIDISNPASPFLVGSYKGEEYYEDKFKGIKVLNNRAYILNENGLNFFDISNPKIPIYLGEITFQNYSSLTSFCIDNQFAYIGIDNWYGSIYIVDISGPIIPSTYLTYNTGVTISQIFASNDYLYAVSKYDSKILVIDTSTPTNLKQASEISCPYFESVYISGAFAYIIKNSHLFIYDITSPESPINTGTYNDNDYCNFDNIFVSGSLAFLHDYSILYILDISNPSNPIKKTEYTYPGISSNRNYSVSGNRLYIAEGRGLRIVDVTVPNNPAFIGSFENYGGINTMIPKGNYLYLAKSYGLQVVDISNPHSPSWTAGAIDIDDNIIDILVHNTYLYAIAEKNNNQYLRVYDLSDPSRPVIKGETQISAATDPTYMKLINDYIYVGGSGLEVYDVSNPFSPIKTTRLPQYSIDLTTYGSYAYLLDTYTEITILNISSPASPFVLNTFSIESAGFSHAYEYTMAIKNNYAYIGGHWGIALYDLSNPTTPELIKKFSTLIDIDSIKINSNIATIHTKESLEYAVLSAPLNPETIGYFSIDYYFNDYVEQNDYLYVDSRGGYEDKIIIFQYSPTQTFPRISLDRTKLYFGAIVDEYEEHSQTVHLNCSGSIPAKWEINSDQFWINNYPDYTGTGSDDIIISINRYYFNTETPGIYSGTVSIHNLQSMFNTQTINVEVQVYDPSDTDLPFGEMATPITDSVVNGSIPVTGWALDDIGIESVKIFLQQGNSQTPIGDAIFVEGARPDIEQTFPTYPNAYKAGWGYMLLTHFLPNNGNGTFKLVASATDHEGNTVILGSKTIICDNAHAVKPFGAIDTPTQGGIASGDSFNHWGWVLTPQPNTIPIDGSTINVYVDGVFQGHPTYNIFRSDIADYFPGYNNSNGAIGHFYLDTTKFSNGVHTIYWTAKDNAGNSDGIGSRYFSITNSNSSQNVNATNSRHSSNGLTVFGNRYTNQQQFPPLHQIPINSKNPLVISKNAPLEAQPETIAANKNGNYLIMAKEMDRIEILFPEDSQLYAGFSMLGMNKRSLPIGSTLDTSENKFSWSIGLGFISQYHLTFIEKTKNGDYQKKFITVMIEPF